MFKNHKISFLAGAGFAAIVVSAVVYATSISITAFTAGTPIVASEVNANFASLANAIQKVGFSASPSTNQTLSMGNTAALDLNIVHWGSYNTSTSTFVVPETGFYQIMFLSKLIASTMTSSIDVLVDSTSVLNHYMTTSGLSEMKPMFLTVGQSVTFNFYCGSSGGSTCQIDSGKTRVSLFKVSD